MTKETMQKNNSHTAILNTQSAKLSIQFNLDGFSFCVIEIATSTTRYFSEYIFEKTQTTPENLLLKIEEIFKTDTHLQHDFTEILVIHQNNLSTLVPNTYFNENNLTDYLNFNIKTLATDFIAFDDLKIIEAKNIYVPYVNINNYLFQNFGEFEYKHHSSIFIEKLIKKISSNDKTMFINVFKNNFDIVVLENKKLLFSNSFFFESKEDFSYYILFTAEQLKLNTDQFKLYFMGKIDTTSDLYKITYQYIRNVFFLESKNPIFKDLKSPNHTHFIQLGT
jgi:hypothetical protein